MSIKDYDAPFDRLTRGVLLILGIIAKSLLLGNLIPWEIDQTIHDNTSDRQFQRRCSLQMWVRHKTCKNRWSIYRNNTDGQARDRAQHKWRENSPLARDGVVTFLDFFPWQYVSKDVRCYRGLRCIDWQNYLPLMWPPFKFECCNAKREEYFFMTRDCHAVCISFPQ